MTQRSGKNDVQKRRDPRMRTYTAYDRALIEAARSDKTVEFSLAMPVLIRFAGVTEHKEHTLICGKVKSVDVFDVEVDWDEVTGTIWLKKAAMTGTRIIHT